MTDWTSQCESALALLQSKDQKITDQPIDVPDGLTSLSKGKTEKKSPKLFKVVSRLVIRTNNKSSSTPDKNRPFK